MLLEELMKDEYKAGKEEGLAEGKELGQEKALQDAKNNVIGILKEKRMPISEELESQIRSVKELQEAMQLFAKATMVDSVQSFENELKKMGY